MKKTGKYFRRKRIGVWLMVLFMTCSLVTVPAKEVEAAGMITVIDATDSSKDIYVEFKAVSTIAAGAWGAGSPAVELTEYNVIVHNNSANVISDWEITVNSSDASSWNAGWNGASRSGNIITIGTYKGTGDDGVWTNAEIAVGETGSGAGFQIAASAINSASVTLTYKEGQSSGTPNVDDTATDPAAIGKTSADVTAAITQSNVDGAYHEYFLKVDNRSAESIADWIVAIPMSGITKVQDWSSWAKVQAYYTSEYLYIVPVSSAVISPGSSFGSVTEGAFKFNYDGSNTPSGATVYYTTGTSSSNAFSSVISNASSGSGSGGSGGGDGDSGAVQGDTTTDKNLNVEYNFAKLLQYSLYFFDANMCGELEGKCGLNWRKNCHTGDKTVTYNGKTIDVSGGFHDAGDHDKFGLPQGYTASILGMGYYEFEDAYVQTGQSGHFKMILDYFCDYFVRCTVLDDFGNAQAFCYQVGDGASHNYWLSAEKENINRPAYFADSTTPATDQVSEAAAALAIHYMNFENETYLDYAKKLFAMAKRNSKAAKTSDGGNYYVSSSWADDYCLAAAWLYKATGDSSYLTEYNNYKGQIQTGAWPSWDQVGPYAQAYGNSDFSPLAANATTIINSTQTISNGYAWLCQWGSARYNCNTQLEGLIFDKNSKTDQYTTWANGQMKFLIGNSEDKRCYIVGYNENSSKYPHHRSSSGYGDFPDNGYATAVQAHSLIGALVGGIKSADGSYHDSAADFYCNEVAIDYNAAFTGAAAALYLRNAEDGHQKIVTAEDTDAPAEIKTFYGSQTSPAVVNVTEVSLDETTVSLTQGETKALTATVMPSNATNKKVSWISDAPAVATVDNMGKVTAVSSGTAKIMVTTEDGSKTSVCTVTVTNPVSDFVLSCTSLSLAKGSTNTLRIESTTPSTPDAYTVTWSSSNPAVATVDTVGKVTANIEGTAEIHATINGITKKCNVTVTVPLESIELNKNTLNLNKGETETLSVTIRPENATEVSYQWRSSDSTVATVTDGEITALKTGTTDITVEAGGKEAVCSVTVRTPVIGITINKSTVSLIKGADIILTAAIQPLDADTKTIIWTSSDAATASVADGKVTALKTGKTTITAEADGQKAECIVTVTNPVTAVALDKTAAELVIGEELTLMKTITPSDADDLRVSWSSSKADVAAVDDTGKVKAAAPGTAVVTVTTANGSKTASCMVTVKKKAQSKPNVTISKTGRTADTIAVSVSPSAGVGTAYEYSINGVKWQTSNTFTGLSEAAGYTVQVRLKETDELQASPVADAVCTISTLVRQPYIIDISRLTNSNYAAGLYETDAAAGSVQTASYDAAGNTLTLLQSDKTYTITGFDTELKVVAGAGVSNVEVILYNAICKSVNAADITVENGRVEIQTIAGSSDIEIKGGTIITDTLSGNMVMISGGNVTAGKGISAVEDIAISGVGTIVTAMGDSGKAGIEAEGRVTISGGAVTATGGMNAAGIKGDTVIITGGTVTAAGTGSGAAIYGETEVALTGGTLTAAVGADKNPGTSIDTGSGENSIIWDGTAITGSTEDIFSVSPVDSNGGFVTAYKVTIIDQKTAIETVTKGKQITLRAVGDKTGKRVSWKDDAGNVYQDGAVVSIERNTIFTAVYTVIRVESVKITLSAYSLIEGQSIRAAVTVLPADAANRNVVWSSRNPSVAEVNGDGVIRAREEGTAVITAASSENPSIYDEVVITVIDDDDDQIRATGIKLSADVKGVDDVPVAGTYKLAPKKKLDLDVTFLPKDAEEEELTFKSSNSKVAKVNKDGRVTVGKKSGKATITVTSENGLKKTFKVQVMKRPVQKVKIRAAKKTVKVKKKLSLKVILSPGKKSASNGVYWKSSNPKIATVSSKGVVKGMKKGKVKITAVATDGSGKKAIVTLRIK